MNRWAQTSLLDFTGLLAAAVVVYFSLFGGWVMKQDFISQIPASLLQLNTIFLSILIEAVPFVLIGVLIAGFIQIFVTEEHIEKWIPQNKFLAVTMSCVVGACFPACECGIVPIVRRLVAKGVPIYAGVGFLLTGPLINPIVIFSTYMAFGNDLKIAGMRMAVGFIAAMIISLFVSLLFNGNQLKEAHHHEAAIQTKNRKIPFSIRFWDMLKHSIDEFFDMGKYLILGAFFAAFVQTYVSAQALLQVGEGWISSTLVMMGLAFILSLCSEADAFIGASFRNIFPATSILAFLVYGPMIDLKNTFMLLSVFKMKFVLQLIALITIIVFICISFLN
ncbi:permease [Bacillus aerolatus]|uniref:Permease n=1 Tax=Bacillus aerolatus TaxID=2653354 RepID=A0A6I1FPM9_9BACI|nr:permease [Bacillus aerolatus]KAB7708642.1 permease [Bacillus aerolatus]